MQRSTKALLTVLTTLCVFSLTQTAFAQAGFQYRVNNKVQAGDGYPTLTLQATGQVDSAKVSFKRSDGKSFSRNLGKMKAGDTEEITIKQPGGTYSYEVTIEANSAGDEPLVMNLEFDATLVEPLEVSVNPDEARVAKGEVPITSNRPIDKIDIAIFDSNGQKVHEGTQQVGGKKGRITVKWPATDDVGGIQIKAHDVDGFWQGVLLEPFWVEIPHKEVIFNFGKATWEDSEEPKLEETLEGVREAMQKHAHKGLQMQLYIAGYTDTVGSKSDNLELSTARARAIARWFRKQGLDIPIFYQGFGESVLRVNTPDETKEPKNRRALYILGNAQPPTSKSLPKSNWKQVK